MRARVAEKFSAQAKRRPSIERPIGVALAVCTSLVFPLIASSSQIAWPTRYTIVSPPTVRSSATVEGTVFEPIKAPVPVSYRSIRLSGPCRTRTATTERARATAFAVPSGEKLATSAPLLGSRISSCRWASPGARACGAHRTPSGSGRVRRAGDEETRSPDTEIAIGGATPGTTRTVCPVTLQHRLP